MEQDGSGRRSLDAELLDASARYFKSQNDRAPTVEQIADFYRRRLPKYFSDNLVRAINGRLRSKVLFGSDYPVLSPDRWIESFDQLGIKPEVRPWS